MDKSALIQMEPTRDCGATNQRTENSVSPNMVPMWDHIGVWLWDNTMMNIRRGTMIGYGCAILIACLSIVPNAQALFPILPDNRMSIVAPTTPKPGMPPPMINGVPIANLIRDGVPPSVDRGVAGGKFWKEGFSDRFRRTGDTTTYSDLVRLMEMRAAGTTKDNILKTLLFERERQTRLGSEYGTRVQNHQIIEGLSGAAGILTIGILAGSGSASLGGMATVSVVKAALGLSDKFNKHGRILRRHQRVVEDFNAATKTAGDPEDRLLNAVGLLYKHDPVFADLYNQLVRPAIGFGPGDSDRTVLENYPQFRDSKILQEVFENLEQGKAVHAAFAETLRQANVTLDALQVQASELQTRQAKEFDTARNEAHVVAYQHAFQLLGYAAGLMDPLAGRQVVAVGKATIEISRAIEAFEATLGLGKDLWGAAGVALTGNLLSAGLKLFNAFADTGLTVEEQILEVLQSGIVRLSEQIETTRQEMHGRFDRVDLQFQAVHGQFRHVHRRFDEIAFLMEQGFNATMLHTTKSDDRTRQDLAKIMGRLQAEDRAIEKHRRIGLDTQSLLIREAERLGEVLLNVHLAPCLRARSASELDAMTDKEYLDCLSMISTLANPSPSDNLGRGEQSIETKIELMRRHSGRMLNTVLLQARRLFAESRQRSGRGDLQWWSEGNELPERVVSPDKWFFVADIHGRLLERAPELTQKFKGNIESNVFVQTMRRHREELVAFLHAIRHSYAHDVAGHSPGLFREMWLEATRRSHAYREVLRQTAMEYYQDPERYRYLREGVPELDLTGNLYEDGVDGAWKRRNWKEHWQTIDGFVPGWFTFPSWRECVLKYPELAIYENAVGTEHNELVTPEQAIGEPEGEWIGRLEKSKGRWQGLDDGSGPIHDIRARYREIYLRNLDVVKSLFIFPEEGLRATTLHNKLFSVYDLLPAKAGIAKIEICAVTGLDNDLYVSVKKPRWWGRIIARYERGDCAAEKLIDEYVSVTDKQLALYGVDVAGTELARWLEDMPPTKTESGRIGKIVVEQKVRGGMRVSTLVDSRTAIAYGIMKKISQIRKEVGRHSSVSIVPRRTSGKQSDCQREYERWFSYEAGKMREWVREKLSNSSEIEKLDESSAFDDEILRTLLKLAFPLASEHSLVAYGFATGGIEFPKYRLLLMNGMDPWRIEEGVSETLNRSFELFQSPDMQRATRAGGVHLRLEATEYQNLGDGESVGLN